MWSSPVVSAQCIITVIESVSHLVCYVYPNNSRAICGIDLFRDEEDGVLVAKEAVMEKRKVQSAVSEWQAEKRRRLEDGEEEVGGDADDEDVQDVQVRVEHPPWCVGLMVAFCLLVVRQKGSPSPNQLAVQTPEVQQTFRFRTCVHRDFCVSREEEL